tara:strand:- start:201 stop:527 length:327 start_codon:yes stop_codon:yes gene_type:complete
MASEVLSVTHNEVSDSEVVLINGVDGHTYTILSVMICETAGNAETIDLFIQDDGGATDYEILSDQAVGANETFELTTKFVILNEDHLTAKCASAAAVDVVVSYLDQTR